MVVESQELHSLNFFIMENSKTNYSSSWLFPMRSSAFQGDSPSITLRIFYCASFTAQAPRANAMRMLWRILKRIPATYVFFFIYISQSIDGLLFFNKQRFTFHFIFLMHQIIPLKKLKGMKERSQSKERKITAQSVHEGWQRPTQGLLQPSIPWGLNISQVFFLFFFFCLFFSTFIFLTSSNYKVYCKPIEEQARFIIHIPVWA